MKTDASSLGHRSQVVRAEQRQVALWAPGQHRALGHLSQAPGTQLCFKSHIEPGPEDQGVIDSFLVKLSLWEISL